MTTKADLLEFISHLVSPDTPHEARMEMYDSWKENYTYDVGVTLQSRGPEFAARYLDKHALSAGLDKAITVLDVACGTGLAGRELWKLDYKNVDGVDACQGMLDQAKLTGLYSQLICSQVGGGHRMPVNNDTYDAAVMSGGFSGGHMKCDALLEILRVVKKGGLIVNVFREVHTREDPEYKKLPSLIKAWEEDGLFKVLEEDIPPEDYQIDEKNALVHVFQKL